MAVRLEKILAVNPLGRLSDSVKIKKVAVSSYIVADNT